MIISCFCFPSDETETFHIFLEYFYYCNKPKKNNILSAYMVRIIIKCTNVI